MENDTNKIHRAGPTAGSPHAPHTFRSSHETAAMGARANKSRRKNRNSIAAGHLPSSAAFSGTGTAAPAPFNPFLAMQRALAPPGRGTLRIESIETASPHVPPPPSTYVGENLGNKDQALRDQGSRSRPRGQNNTSVHRVHGHNSGSGRGMGRGRDRDKSRGRGSLASFNDTGTGGGRGRGRRASTGTGIGMSSLLAMGSMLGAARQR